jgi:hypothetical protein
MYMHTCMVINTYVNFPVIGICILKGAFEMVAKLSFEKRRNTVASMEVYWFPTVTENTLQKMLQF